MDDGGALIPTALERLMAEPEITPATLLLAEYERVKAEQQARIGFRDNLLYATLASMAGVVAAALAGDGGANLLLLLPPVCVILGWTYLVNDEKVSAIGRYVRSALAPELSRLSGRGPNGVVFGWEAVHRTDDDRMLRKASQLVVDLGTFCVSALAAIAIYWINGPWTPAFLAVSVAELLAVVGLGIQIVRYADLRTGV